METTKKILSESLKINQGIRVIVKDIITLFKTEEEGEFYLPEDINDDFLTYEFKNYNISIVLNMSPNEEIDDYKVDADFYHEEDLIIVYINYNPEEKNKILYNLIGELNEVLRHELQHANQKFHNTHKLGGEEVEDPFKYYTQDHEIDAQVRGFNRLSKLIKKPFNDVVKEWFQRNKDIHNLSQDEIDKVIKILINYRSNL